MSDPEDPVCLGVVVPLYNEGEVLPKLKETLLKFGKTNSADLRFYLVNDGSTDDTAEKLSEWADEDDRVKVVELSRNFGHQAALSAGLDHVGEEEQFVVIMDGDLQDPPELIADMLKKAHEGYEVVYAKRRQRAGESAGKRFTASLFYRLFNGLSRTSIPEDVGDFRLINRNALAAFQAMPEQHRFARGMFSWIGFSQAEVEFDRERRHAGETKYSYRKMCSLAWNAATSFSSLPLRLAMLPGLATILFGMVYTGYTLFRHFTGHTVPGWSTLVILICFFGSSILIALWAIAEYLAKVFEEVKGRPLYIVKRTRNL